MRGINHAIYNLRSLDEAADRRSAIHDLHPAAKIVTVLIFILTVVSFGKYEIADLLPLAFFPVIVFLLAGIPAKPLLARLLAASPVVLFIGMFNPIFDQTPYNIFGIAADRGWISFISLIIKYLLTVSSVLLLVGTTGMTRISQGLETLRMPRILTVQLLLVYRYVYVLLEEVLRLLRAYAQRSGYLKRISAKTGGTLLGGLFIRTHGRAERIYLAMCQRGFIGRMINTSDITRFNKRDVIFTVLWSSFFIAVKITHLPYLLGSLFI